MLFSLSFRRALDTSPAPGAPRRPWILRVPATAVGIGWLVLASAAAGQTNDEQLAEALVGFREKVAAGDLEGAISDLESIRQVRDDVPAQVDAILGGLYAEVGRSAEALELLRPLADGDGADPAVLYNAGRAALDQGEVQTADRYLTQAVRRAPDSPAARTLGLLRGRLGQTAESYALLRRWVGSNPNDHDARLAAAAGAVELERPVEAEALLAELPQDDPGVQLLWGRTLLQKGDPYGAIGYLTPLLDGAPEPLERDARGLLAEAHNTVGNSAEAVAVLEGRTAEDPAMSLQLGIAQYRNGSLEAASSTLRPFAERLIGDEDYRTAIAPHLSARIMLEYGRMLHDAGRSEDALPFLETATRLRPDTALAWQSLGQALLAEGERDRAEQAMARFQELSRGGRQGSAASTEYLQDPTGSALRRALAMLESDPERALQRIRAEAAIAPNDPRPRLFESRALLLSGEPAQSLAVARQVAATIAGQGLLEADAHYLIGTAQVALEDLAEAEAAFRRALEIAPEHTGAMTDLATVLIADDRVQEARELLRRVLEIRPEDPLATRILQDLDG